jgi:hypothetical protein
VPCPLVPARLVFYLPPRPAPLRRRSYCVSRVPPATTLPIDSRAEGRERQVITPLACVKGDPHPFLFDKLSRPLIFRADLAPDAVRFCARALGVAWCCRASGRHTAPRRLALVCAARELGTTT